MASNESFGNRLLAGIERAGNALPDAVTLFLSLILALLLTSALAAMAGVSAVHPVTGETISIVNLLSGDMLRQLFTQMPQTFAQFPPLGTVVVAMLGVGLAEKAGLFDAALSSFVRKIPRPLLSIALVFAGIMSSLAVDAGYVVLIPLGGVLFAAAGRHPIAGLAAAFAGVSAGFSANLLITPLDALLAGLTQSAAAIVAPEYVVPITGNYYIIVTLVPIFTLVAAWLTDRVIEPRLGQYQARHEAGEDGQLSPTQQRGLRRALIVMGGLLIGALALALPAGAPLRDDSGSLGPFYQSLVAFTAIIFAAGGITYGAATGKVGSDRDAVRLASDAMADLGLYLVIAFMIAHFIALFSWSNIGIWVAVNGAASLQAIGLSGLPLTIGFVLLVGFINLFIGSASAKWALLAPVFVPMLMLLGFAPEFTQAAYRMGDAFTNIITPIMPYMPMVIVFMQKYRKDFGIGTVIALMLPYSILMGLSSLLLLAVWIVADLPLGPGRAISYQPPA